ncbi:MAG: hypothetical protein KY433_07065, partial [Actinobacteria bacterium]|nr:hypothetical protein [Actinomycetota bacterium]
QVIVQVLDEDMNRLAQSEHLLAPNPRGEVKKLSDPDAGVDVVTLAPPAPDGSARPTQVFLDGPALEAILNARRFNVNVSGRTPAVEYALPDDVVAATRARYIEAYEKVSGRSFDEWLTQVTAR